MAHFARAFVVIAAVALLAGCRGVSDYLATDPYDIAIANTDRDPYQVVVAGGHHDPYTFEVDPGEDVYAQIRVQSYTTSGTSYYGGTEYRSANVQVTATNLRTGRNSGTIGATLYYPGRRGITVSGGGNVSFSLVKDLDPPQ